MDIIGTIGILLSPITGVVTWVVARKQRNNNFLTELQTSIDLLTDRNTKLLAEIVVVKEQNARLLIQVGNLTTENEQLKSDFATLSLKLDNVKSITRKQ